MKSNRLTIFSLRPIGITNGTQIKLDLKLSCSSYLYTPEVARKLFHVHSKDKNAYRQNKETTAKQIQEKKNDKGDLRLGLGEETVKYTRS